MFVYFFLLLFPKLTKKGTNAGKREQTRAKSTTKNRGRRVGEDWSTAVLGD
ncbi:hypothetical protein HMPREF1574_00980, partial [Gardnerella pickettii JCP7659]